MDRAIDEKSWSDWARNEGWKALKFKEDAYGSREPGVWVCIEAGMTITSPERPYVVAAASREAATEVAVDLALDYLEESPTEEYARRARHLRKDWEDLRALPDEATSPVGEVSVQDLIEVHAAQILELANADGARLSVDFAHLDLATLPEPPRARLGRVTPLAARRRGRTEE